jgi:hypothetical protein
MLREADSSAGPRASIPEKVVMRLSLATTLAAILGLFAASRAQQPAPVSMLQTRAEASGFTSTSTYDDVVRFMKEVAAASSNTRYSTYGRTVEGRDLPLAIVGRNLGDATPATVRASGKLRVHIQGNIHAGEVDGKESAQMLLRDLGRGRHDDWLESTIFLITPILNADGNEKMSLTSRLPQHGPVNGQGTRANAQNININRDFTKLETPEGRAFARLWAEYDPHVGLDLHTSDGSFHAYHLTYSPPLNPGTSTALVNLMKGEWFPFITRNIKARDRWDTFYYGNASNAGPGAAPSRAWATFSHLPRYHNNYVGLRNRFALLSESYSYLTFEDRIHATNAFLRESLAFAHQNAAKLKALCDQADNERLIGTILGTRADFTRGGAIDILMGEVETVKNPVDGSNMYLRKDVSRVEPMVDMLWFRATATEEVPSEFYIPASAITSLDLLRAHGIRMRQLTAPLRGVEQFAMTSNTARPPSNSPDVGGHAVRTLEGNWRPAPDVVVPAGAWAIPMEQPLARLAFYLLAPTSDDGLAYWNFLDAELKDATVYPVFRTR